MAGPTRPGGGVHPASCSAAPRRPRARPWLTPIARERQKNERLFVLPSFLWRDVCWVARYDVLQIPGLIEFDLGTVLQVTGGLSLKVSLAVAAAIAVLAGLDYFYQRYEWERSLRMSKEEVKEEHKATDGDPLIKSRVRAIQREMTKKRMMAAVKTADVVIMPAYSARKNRPNLMPEYSV